MCSVKSGLSSRFGEVPGRRARLGADDHHDIGLAAAIAAPNSVTSFCGPCPPTGSITDAGGLRTQPLHHRPRVVVRLAQLRGHRPGDLELPQADDHVDGLGDVVGVGAGVGQRGLGGLGGQFDRRHAPVAGVVDVLGELADADDDGCARDLTALQTS